MQSSLSSDNYIDPKFLARGASLLARQLGHQRTDIFRRSLENLLVGRANPLSPTEVGICEDILTSPLGNQSLAELNHVKFCDFDDKQQAHFDAVGDLLMTTSGEYASQSSKTSARIQMILAEEKKVPIPPKTLTITRLWNDLMQKQKNALTAQRLRYFKQSVKDKETEIIDTFHHGSSLHFDPNHMILGVVDEAGESVLGDDVVHGLKPTGQPGHIFSQYGDNRYAVCEDTQGNRSILEYSDQNMFWSFGMKSKIPPKFLERISSEEIVETRELQTYTGKPLFFARARSKHGDEYILCESIMRMPRINIGNPIVSDISGDVIITHHNGSSVSLKGTKILSILTGQEFELRDSHGTLQMTENDGVIQFDERTQMKFDGETPEGKEFSEKVGGFFGIREVRLSDLVKIWKKVALREAGRKI